MKTPIQVRQTCHHKTGTQEYLSLPHAKSWTKLSVLDFLGMEILIVQTPASLLWTTSWSSSADLHQGCKPPQSQSSWRYFRCKPDSQQGPRQWSWAACGNTGEAMVSCTTITPCLPLPLAAWPRCSKGSPEHSSASRMDTVVTQIEINRVAMATNSTSPF